jgi:hypothetical protein
MPNLQDLIDQVEATTGIPIEPDDPAIAFVKLSELVLDQVARRVVENINRRLAAFEVSMNNVDQLAGKELAQEVQCAAEKMRAALHQDIEKAGLRAAHLVYKVQEANTRPPLVRWFSAGLLAAIAIFLSGLWAGAHLWHLR